MKSHETAGKSMQWAIMPGGCYCACNRTVSRLPPGAYTFVTDEFGKSVFAQRQLEVDDLIDFPGSLPAKIVEEIERFWTKGERFRHWVEISDGLSFASLAELVISVRCLDNDLMETATQLRELETHQPTSDDDDGFCEFETARNGRFSSRRSLDAEIPF